MSVPANSSLAANIRCFAAAIPNTLLRREFMFNSLVLQFDQARGPPKPAKQA